MPYSLEKAECSQPTKLFLTVVMQHGSLHHVENCYKFTMQVEGQAGITELLEAVLSNWIDFLLVSPQSFAIYADRDEY